MKKKSTEKKLPRNSPKKKTSRKSQLERATAAYFASLSPEALKEENHLGAALAHAASQVDFDADY